MNAAVLVDLETAADHHQPLSVVRGRTPMDGRWLLTDRALAAAYRIYRLGMCDGCGGVLEDTTDQGKYGSQGTHVHEHDKPVKCLRCESRLKHFDDIKKNEKFPNLLRWATRVVKR